MNGRSFLEAQKTDNMKVLHFSTFDTKGGASRATYKLHQNLLDSGHSSELIVLEKFTDDETVKEVDRKLTLAQRLNRKVNTLLGVDSEPLEYDEKYYFQLKEQFQHVYPKSKYLSLSDIKEVVTIEPDVIMLHWVNAFMSPKLIGDVLSHFKVPSVWYFLDQNAVTGGCHYTYSCVEYQRTCSNCPAITSSDKKAIAKKQLKAKNKYLKGKQIAFAVGCTDDMQMIQSSSVFGGSRVEKIMAGVDEDLYNQTDKKIELAGAKLPSDKFIIYAAAEHTGDKRKGFNYLERSLELLYHKLDAVDKERVHLLTVGNAKGLSFDLDHTHIPFISDQKVFSDTYKCADVFVSTSIMDSGPMSIMEAMVSGVPVASFNVGAAMDLVVNGKTGYRCEIKDVGTLTDNLLTLFNTWKNDRLVFQEIRDNCRQTGLKHCSYSSQLNSFLNLFGELTGR